MKIVIEIPEEIYNSIQDNDYCGILNSDMYNAVKNGTSLPKGHGDLIDRTEVIKSLFDYHNGKKTIGQCIDDVPTIIEAEKTTINQEKTTITDGDLISRDFMKEMGATCIAKRSKTGELVAISSIDNLPKQRTGYCKNCKYFEYDSVAKVDGIPLIVAHEICKKWGDGCKTKEDGYCFLFEPKESEDKE